MASASGGLAHGTAALRRRRRGRRHGAMNEINMTPFIDVMLVLLVIFMVTAPLIKQSVHVNLPEAKAAPVEAGDDELILTIDVKRQIYIEKVPLTLRELESKLASNAKVQAHKKVNLQADRDVPYGFIVDVLAAAQRAGISNVGMITDPLRKQ